MFKIAVFIGIGMAASGSANAGYVGSVVGLADGSQSSSLSINAGDSFTGAVMLDGSLGTQSDFALFRLVSSIAGLEYSAGWYDWSSPFTTGGVDDYSSPGPGASGVMSADTYQDPFAIGDVDVVFENVSDSFGEYFGTGMILTFTLTVPETFAEGSFTIDFAADTFTNGASFVDAVSGQGLTVNVIPTPATAFLLAFGGLAASTRKR